jgi:plasmid maintenance system antidote protein VapI
MASKGELREWMRKHSYGTSEAAKHLHVDVRTVQRWLKGERRIPDWLDLVLGLEG